MKVTAVLFDLDGTVIDTNQLIINSFVYTIEKHLGYEIDAEKIIPYFGEPLPLTLQRFSKDNWEIMLQTYREYNERYHDRYTTIREDVGEVLRILKEEGLKTAVVTSKRKELAKKGLKLFEIDKYFDVIIGLEDTEKHKPNPEPVLKALDLLESSAEEALMVGDSPYDILAARNAGVKSVAVKWSVLPFNLLEKEKPDFFIEDMWQLLKIIKGCDENDYA
ncbi:pyrophosphatase PpaX [Caldanaerobacter sp.]|uniref:pyrophosphatase PpaX n=1 Tax=Caldanaerobacter sp. TaxID=2930036 RepID=UPI003C7263A3